MARGSGGPLWPDVCSPGDISSSFPFCDLTLSHPDRAADLIGRLTLEEKQSLLVNDASGVPRLGIPPYQWWSEGLHGPLEPCVTAPLASGGPGGATTNATRCPTSLPAPSAMASAFNDTLYLLAGRVIGVEGRSISNVRAHDGSVGDGLTYWAPNANMQRDPRWGRNMEAPGEDPHLASRYVSHYVRGMQGGEDMDRALVAATCKHFVANELEMSEVGNRTVTRHDFDAEIPLPDLADYYLPAFEACVRDGRALGIMCSYNAVNGVPMCANKHLLDEILRGRWGFDGYVTSDCGAISDISGAHGFAPDDRTAAAMGLRAGCDTDCGSVYGASAAEAVRASLLSEGTIDVSLGRLVRVQMKLGLFDPKVDQVYFDPAVYGINRIDSEEHRVVAKEAALQSIVLLKNNGGVLPLRRGIKIALVGPHVEARGVFLSNYYGERCPDRTADCVESPLLAIAKANGEDGAVTSASGCDVDGGADRISEAIAAAVDADAVVMLLGLDGDQEGEGHDRDGCSLPGLQPRLVRDIAALGRPTIAVLLHGGAMCLGDLGDLVPAVVDAFYGGEMGAGALADVLFGAYNPTGKLPVTMYPPEYLEENPITVMSVTAPPGRTHLYYNGTPEFAFGTGLSYSSWTMEVSGGGRAGAKNTAAEEVEAGDVIWYAVRLTNRGPLRGAQRVLAYVRPRGGPLAGDGGNGGGGGSDKAAVQGMFRRRLWAYMAVEELNVGESSALDFSLDVSESLAVSDGTGAGILHPGSYEIVFSDGTAEETVAPAPLVIAGRPSIVRPSPFRQAAATEADGERDAFDDAAVA